MQQSVTSKIGTSKGWTLALGIGAALLAAILLVVYLNRYRSSVDAQNAATPVLVAKNLIPQGTSGTIIAKKELFQVASLPKDDLKVGAISDPAYLNGRVAAGDIFPGQQITTADLSVTTTEAVPTSLTGVERAVAVPIDASRGLVGYTAQGDHVDVYVGLTDGNDAPDASRAGRRDPPRAGAGPVHDVRPQGCCAARPEARVRVGCWNALVPAATAGRRQEDAAADGVDEDASRPGQAKQAGEVAPRWLTLLSAHSSPSKGWTPSTCSEPCPTTRISSSSASPTASTTPFGRCRAARSTSSSSPARGVRTIGRSRSSTERIAPLRNCRSSSSPRRRPNGFLRRAFDVGAADMALFPQTKEQLRFVMSKAVARAPRKGSGPRSERDSRLVCVLGPKGGTGKTLTSCNLAVALALAGQKVLIIDLDLQFGDVGLCLGLPPEKTMYDLALSGGSLDEDKLSDYVMTHDAGVDVLLAPARPDQASAITIELLRDVLVVARSAYDFVIADTPPGFTAEVIATIDASSDLVMVGTLDSLSLKNTKLGLETLGLMEYDPKKIQLVLNRADTRVGISQHDVVAVLGSEPNIFIPSDREIPRSVNEGIPIILSRPQSYAAASFHDLAGLFVSATPAPNGAEPVGAVSAESSAPARQSRSLFRFKRK